MILPGFQRSTADFIKGKGFAAAGTEPSWIHFDCWGFPKTKRTALVSKKGFLHCNTIAFQSCNGRGKYYDSNALFNLVPCIRCSFGSLVRVLVGEALISEPFSKPAHRSGSKEYNNLERFSDSTGTWQSRLKIMKDGALFIIFFKYVFSSHKLWNFNCRRMNEYF